MRCVRAGGHSPVGKMFVVCDVELSDDGEPRRFRVKHNPDGAAKTLHGFIGQTADSGAHIIIQRMFLKN